MFQETPISAGSTGDLGCCPACKRRVTLDDDFARLDASLYHLGCLFGALRRLGEDAALAPVKAGLDALGRAKTPDGSLPTPPHGPSERRSPRTFTVAQ